VEILENGLEHNRNRNVSERVGRLIENMVQALNVVQRSNLKFREDGKENDGSLMK